MPRSSTTNRPGYGFRNSGLRGSPVPPVLLDDRSHRRFSEFIVPSSVILTGVLAVVGFAFAVNGMMRSRDTIETLPPAQPPALASAALPPVDQRVIPIPGVSPSGVATSVSARPGAAPSPDGSAQPSRAPAAPDGAVTISRERVPQQVDLSAEGTTDWVHWGQQNTYSLERRKDGGFSILEGTPTAPRFRHELSPQRFNWSDGSPVKRSAGTPTGIRTCGAKNGFTITAPAGRGTRTLRLYVGVSEARGRLAVRLSTGGDTVRATLDSRSAGLDTAVFVVTYRAKRSGTVQVSWLTERSYNADCGGVALQAATLR